MGLGLGLGLHMVSEPEGQRRPSLRKGMAMAPMQSRDHCNGGRGMSIPGVEEAGLDIDLVRHGGDCAGAKSEGKMS